MELRVIYVLNIPSNSDSYLLKKAILFVKQASWSYVLRQEPLSLSN